MKKTLLSLLALCSASAMFALEPYTNPVDITPGAYVYSDYTPQLAGGIVSPTTVGGAHISWVQAEGAKYWKNGIVAVCGTPPANATFIHMDYLYNGMQVIDFGGTLGKVWCISSNNSTLNEDLTSILGTNPGIVNADANVGYFNLHWFLHPDALASIEGKRVTAEIELNFYSKFQSDDNLINKIYFADDNSTVHPNNNNDTNIAGNAVLLSEFAKTTSSGVNALDDNGDNIWDHTKYITYKVETDIPSTTYPMKLKMEINNNAFNQGTALLIRSVRFIADDNASSVSTERERTTNYYTVSGANVTGIEDVEVSAADENAPVEYFDLQGRPVQHPAGGIFIKKQGNKVSKTIIQ